MRVVRIAGLVVLVSLAGSWSAAEAGWGVGVRFGGPYYGGGYYRPYYGGYYAPYPVVVAPPVVVQQPPVVVQQPSIAVPQPPAATLPAPSQYTPPPAQLLTPPRPDPTSASLPVVAASANTDAPEVGQSLTRLGDPNESVRVEAAMWLGRNKVRSSVPALSRSLASDGSPRVREASARALGLIASEQSLPALQTAAQADDDREVRHSAQFAAEIIRGNLRGR